jgi:serine phosphatase RsbU (regulator of sigma subunit)
MLEEGPRSRGEEGLSIARNIQAAMIPRRLPAMEGLEMASLYLPSSAVGGDLFDVIHLTEDRLALYMFDVAHHGVSAALISSMAKVSFSEQIRSIKSPKLVMARVNSQMLKNISADYYLTAIVAFLDLHDNKLTYCNAGHAYPIMYKRKEQSLEQLSSTGVFVGIMENGGWFPCGGVDTVRWGNVPGSSAKDRRSRPGEVTGRQCLRSGRPPAWRVAPARPSRDLLPGPSRSGP